MTEKTMEAIRRLAERPGTEAEGAVAREMLARLESRLSDTDEALLLTAYRRFLRRELSLTEFLEAMKRPMTREEDMAANEIRCRGCWQWIRRGSQCDYCIERARRLALSSGDCDGKEET